MNALIGARDGPKPSNALAIGKECQDSDIALPIADFSNARHLIRKALGGRIKVMTLQVLEKEILSLPPRSRVQLVERIIESIDDYADPKLETEWHEEIERRTKEITSGAEKGISAKKVMKEARRALDETRRVSSARRK